MKRKFNWYRLKENLGFGLSISSFLSLVLYFSSSADVYAPLAKTVIATTGEVTVSSGSIWFGLLAIILISVAIYLMKDKIKIEGTNLMLLISAVDLGFISMIAFIAGNIIWIITLLLMIILIAVFLHRKKDRFDTIKINHVKGKVKKRLLGLLFFGVGASFLMVMASDIKDYLVSYGIWGKVFLVVVGVILISIGAVFFVKEGWN